MNKWIVVWILVYVSFALIYWMLTVSKAIDKQARELEDFKMEMRVNINNLNKKTSPIKLERVTPVLPNQG
jgi:hypothetical protein